MKDSAHHSHSSKSGLLKSAFILAVMTMASRIFGMLRDVVSAKTFGTGWMWDGFLYAFTIPSFFRRIVGEGALSSAFIPVYNDIREKQSEAEAFRYANLVFTFCGVALLVFLGVVELGLTLAVHFGTYTRVMALTLDLLRTLFPHIWFISAYAVGMGVLNSHKKFFAPTLGPVLMNLIWIAVMLWIFPFIKSGPITQLRVLGWAITFAGFVHWWVEWPFLSKMGFRFRSIWEPAHEGLLRSWKLLIPVLLSFAAVQVNILVDTGCAYFIGEGANSSLWYGTRVMQLPLGVFGVAMGTALLPMLSSQVAAGKKEEAKHTLAFALRVVFMIVLPAAAGLIALRTDIMRFLFERGRFDAVSTARTASVLAFYSIGLFAYAGQKMMITGYYAAHDSKTPMRLGLIALASNATMNLILMHFLRESGLALSTSISAIIQFLMLIYHYPKKVGDFPMREMAVSFAKSLFAAVVMGLFAWGMLSLWSQQLPPWGKPAIYALELFATIATALIVYILISLLVHGSDAKQVFSYLTKKNKKI